MAAMLPAGVQIGHWSDFDGVTGCTVVLCPDGSVAACEVRGGAPGTRETDLLGPAAMQPGANAILLAGGSAFGLAAADGVAVELGRRGIGYATPAGPVPLVAAAVVYDRSIGDATAHPGPEAGAAAVRAAAAGPPERGTVGVGVGCTVGKADGPAGWTKGGFGFAATPLGGDGIVAAVAAVNAFGEILAEDGSILAGVRSAGAFRRTAEILAERPGAARAGESTTLVCVLTDAALDKTGAWLVARAASAGVARAVDPAGTALDGDAAFCVATGRCVADPVLVGVLAADVVAAAIRDGARSATGIGGCPIAGAHGGR